MPWKNPYQNICGYYGEKVGLYFYYMSYFTKNLAIIATIGLAFSLIQWILDTSNGLYILLTFLYAFL